MHLLHIRYFLHRRVKLKFSGSRARHFRARSRRDFSRCRAVFMDRTSEQVCTRSIFSNTEYLRVCRIGLSIHLRVWCTFIERYPDASEARDGTSDADAALLSRADEISRCSCPIIELQVVSDSQRVFTAQCDGLSLPCPPIIRHRIISHNELQIAHFAIATMSRSFRDYSSKIAKYCCFKSSKK